ncbi:hypothetical protein KI387_005640, partial [Taxus chinensis]
PHEALDVALCTEVLGSVDTGVSSLLEAQIAAMDKQLENLSVNLAHETHS